jgi:C-terminal processing protease CtpA/Prc
VNNLPADKENIYAMLNMDMLGKYNGKLDVMGAGTASEFNDIFNSVDYDTTKMTLKLHKKAYSGSDHASFIKKGIPAVFFYASSGKDYHTPEDDIEFVDAKSAAMVMTYIANAAVKLSNHKETLTFVEVESKKSGGHSSGGLVKLGVVPAFEETNNTGMIISGVSEDGPAQKAGMQSGDKITAINGEAVNNIYDYMARLQKLKSGELITVKIIRDGKEEVIEIQL